MVAMAAKRPIFLVRMNDDLTSTVGRPGWRLEAARLDRARDEE
jgi:hypothetical protein